MVYPPPRSPSTPLTRPHLGLSCYLRRIRPKAITWTTSRQITVFGVVNRQLPGYLELTPPRLHFEGIEYFRHNQSEQFPLFNNATGALATPEGTLIMNAPNLLPNWFEGDGTGFQIKRHRSGQLNYWD